MKSYSIRDWEVHFENNRSRGVDRLQWIPIPNRHDGENFQRIVRHKDGATIYAAWVICVQVASKCQPRGRLLRGDGSPHSAESLSLKTGAPASWFKLALDFLERETDWLVVQDVAVACHLPATQLPSACQPSDSEVPRRKEENGMEEKEEKPSGTRASARLLSYLNEKTGSAFRAVDSNLKLIEARLSEPEVSEDGIRQMIDRQCARWKSDPKMAEYLRPVTLFGKEKFNGYYDMRNAPVQPINGGSHHRPSLRSSLISGGEEWDRQAAEAIAAVESGLAPEGFGTLRDPSPEDCDPRP